jgi:lipid A 4'-phosphatase
MTDATRDSTLDTKGSWSTVAMLKACVIAFIALTVVFVPFPAIDLWVAELFYNGQNDFWLRQSLITAWKNAYIRPAVGVVAVVGLLYYLYRRLTDKAHKAKQMVRYGFFILCVIMATGLVVHAVFKDNWGRARPKHVVQFDGEMQFTPALIPAAQCERNCSFVSGDASLGFATLALALFATRRRNFWILVSVGAGLGLGALRVMNGSHFLSDVLYAGVFTCGTVLLMYRWIIEGHWREDGAPLRKVAGGLGSVAAGVATPGMRGRLGRARVRLRRIIDRVL